MTSDELKKARKILGLTQSAMADALGLSVGMIQSMESGRREIRFTVELAVRYLLQPFVTVKLAQKIDPWQ